MALPGLKTLRRMFGLDWRSLALMRIGVAFVILCDLWVSARNLRAFYTDGGVLPRQMVRDNFAPGFSVHMLGGSAGFEAALFALEAIFALMMLVGYRTRLATIGCWFLLLSRQARNPLALFGADMIEHNTMFWAMFLPLNRRFSMDVAQGRVARPAEPAYCGMAGLGAIAQFLVIYLMSSVLKTGSNWVDHSAVSLALSLDMYARPLGQWLNQFDGLTAFLTVYTVYLEFYGPLLCLCPVATGWARLLACALLCALQLGFGICMQMGLFWVAMNVFTLMLLPAEFWTWIANPAGAWAARLLPPSPPRAPAAPPAAAWQRDLAFGLRLMRDSALAAITVCMICDNINYLPNQPLWQPAGWRAFAAAVGLDGGYTMFTPNPQTDDGWFVLASQLVNGRSVNLLNGAAPAILDKPADVPATYIDQRWGSYFFNFLYPDYQKYLENLALYEERQWDATHSGGEQLQSLQIIFMHQVNGPHHAKTDPAEVILWTENFGN
jgi:hypothetical protein